MAPVANGESGTSVSAPLEPIENPQMLLDSVGQRFGRRIAARIFPLYGLTTPSPSR